MRIMQISNMLLQVSVLSNMLVSVSGVIPFTNIIINIPTHNMLMVQKQLPLQTPIMAVVVFIRYIWELVVTLQRIFFLV